MGAFESIVVLSLVGFLLLAAEVFVPGMVLGILGGFCLLGSAAVAYFSYGAFIGSLVLAVVAVLSVAGFVIWMFAFPHTPIGRRIILNQNLVGGEGMTREDLAGKDGEALTPLRPSGTALVDGRKIDVVAESDFISAGEAVTVMHHEGMRVVVRKKH